MEQQQWEDQVRRFINEELDRREIEEKQQRDEFNRRVQERVDLLNNFDTNEFVFLREKLPHEYADAEKWEHPCRVQKTVVCLRGWVEKCGDCGWVRPDKPAEPRTDGWIHDCNIDQRCDFVPSGFARCGYCGVERA